MPEWWRITRHPPAPAEPTPHARADVHLEAGLGRSVDVHGSLSREVIRRVVQLHLNEVRLSYEQQLVHQPNLHGRVVAAFVIAANGSVQSAADRESTLNSRPAEACIAQAIQRWMFPSPEGGVVVVVNSYPFTFGTR